MPKDASALEIHFINVSQGDSILLINRDLDELKKKIEAAGKTVPTDSLDWLPFAVAQDPSLDLEGTVKAAVLIDGGEDYYGGDVFNYVERHGVKGSTTQASFSTVTSHYHSDHTDGLRLIYKKLLPTVVPTEVTTKTGTKIVDKIVKKIVDNYPPHDAYDMGDDADLDPPTLTYSNYIADINGFVAAGQTTRTTLKPGSTFDMGQDQHGVPITFRCLAANGVVYKGNGATDKDIIDRKKEIDQNDRSVVLVVEYGDFRCLLGGDAGGNGGDEGGNFGVNQDSRDKQFWSSHGDLETYLRTAVQNVYPKDPKRSKTVEGHICCFKAHHHGSASSNDVFFMGTIQPCLFLCSCGTRIKFHGHPAQEAINRTDKGKSVQWPTPTSDKGLVLANSIQATYFTEMAVDGVYGWGGVKKRDYDRDFPNGKILGDVVVRPFGQVTPANADGTNTISIQVYGSGEQAAHDGEKTLRDVNSTKTLPNYPVGPWEHSCDKH